MRQVVRWGLLGWSLMGNRSGCTKQRPPIPGLLSKSHPPPPPPHEGHNAHHAKVSTPLTIGGVVTGLTEPRVLADLRPNKSPRTSPTPISMAPNDECFVVSEDLIDSI